MLNTIDKQDRDEWEELEREYQKDKILREILADTLSVYESRKTVSYREDSLKGINKQDRRLIKGFIKGGSKESLIELIHLYTPLILSMVRKPFSSLQKKRLNGMQRRINFYFKDSGIGYWYISSRAKDIVQQALLGFIELVYEYDESIGSFSGFVKSYLPYKIEELYRNILDDCKNVYFDAFEDGYSDMFTFEKLSYSLPELSDDLDLSHLNLTDKQLVISQLLAEGLNISEVARELGISRAGVDKHISGIRKKFLKAG